MLNRIDCNYEDYEAELRELLNPSKKKSGMMLSDYIMKLGQPLVFEDKIIPFFHRLVSDVNLSPNEKLDLLSVKETNGLSLGIPIAEKGDAKIIQEYLNLIFNLMHAKMDVNKLFGLLESTSKGNMFSKSLARRQNKDIFIGYFNLISHFQKVGFPARKIYNLLIKIDKDEKENHFLLCLNYEDFLKLYLNVFTRLHEDGVSASDLYTILIQRVMNRTCPAREEGSTRNDAHFQSFSLNTFVASASNDVKIQYCILVMKLQENGLRRNFAYNLLNEIPFANLYLVTALIEKNTGLSKCVKELEQKKAADYESLSSLQKEVGEMRGLAQWLFWQNEELKQKVEALERLYQPSAPFAPPVVAQEISQIAPQPLLIEGFSSDDSLQPLTPSSSFNSQAVLFRPYNPYNKEQDSAQPGSQPKSDLLIWD